MASTKYTYNIVSAFPFDLVNNTKLTSEIVTSSITKILERVDTDGSNCDIWFDNPLSGGETTTLNALVAAHYPVVPVLPILGVSTGSSSGPTTTSASFVTLTDMTRTFTIQEGKRALVIFNGTFRVQNGDDFNIALFQNGSEISGTRQQCQFTGASGLLGLAPGAIDALPVSLFAVVAGLTTGTSYTFDVRWKRNAGTARAVGTLRQLTVTELAS